jgi:pyridoxamine 5'-phosphate oxidase
MSEERVAFEVPFERFGEVLRQAEATGMENPNAMVVASVGEDGRPSTRVVLLKHFDRDGFVFYTNLESRKGRQIRANPRVSLNFYWRELEKQVVVEGSASLVPDEEADAYFGTRSRGSQLGAWASQQSRPLPSRAHLLGEVARLETRYLAGPVPRPPHWSGFRVVPVYFELWVAGPFRLHDRAVFERDGDGWRTYKLYP